MSLSHRGVGVLVEPDDRLGHLLEDFDPGLEDAGRNAPQTVERAEYHPLGGQAVVLAGGKQALIEDFGVEVLEGVGLVAVRHVHQPLERVVVALLWRGHDAASASVSVLESDTFV